MDGNMPSRLMKAGHVCGVLNGGAKPLEDPAKEAAAAVGFMANVTADGVAGVRGTRCCPVSPSSDRNRLGSDPLRSAICAKKDRPW